MNRGLGKRKVYFSHYGEIVSLDLQDALKLCSKAINTGRWNIEGYSSSRVLSGVFDTGRKGYFKRNGKVFEVNNCLDWTREEWEECIGRIKKEER